MMTNLYDEMKKLQMIVESISSGKQLTENQNGQLLVSVDDYGFVFDNADHGDYIFDFLDQASLDSAYGGENMVKFYSSKIGDDAFKAEIEDIAEFETVFHVDESKSSMILDKIKQFHQGKDADEIDDEQIEKMANKIESAMMKKHYQI